MQPPPDTQRFDPLLNLTLRTLLRHLMEEHTNYAIVEEELALQIKSLDPEEKLVHVQEPIAEREHLSEVWTIWWPYMWKTDHESWLVRKKNSEIMRQELEVKRVNVQKLREAIGKKLALDPKDNRVGNVAYSIVAEQSKEKAAFFGVELEKFDPSCLQLIQGHHYEVRENQ